MMNRYLVRFGRTDGSVSKSVPEPYYKAALHLANSLAFLLWQDHPFKNSLCHNGLKIERDGTWIEVCTNVEVDWKP